MQNDPDTVPRSPHTKALADVEMRDTVVVEGGALGGDLFLPDAEDDRSEIDDALAAEALAHADELALQSMQLEEDAALEYQHGIALYCSASS
jgi:hypothetical protein